MEKLLQNNRIMTLLFGLIIALGSLWAWYVYHLGLTLVFIDQNAHLLFSRQLFDSITPGFSQIGFWPPLLHLLVAPFTLINPLFHSGLAASIVLIFALASSAVFAYGITQKLSGSRTVSLLLSIAFVANPYLLYYSVTPMMESLFVACVLGCMYFYLLWWESGRLLHLGYLSIFVCLASIARFEGLLLLPLVSVLCVGKLIKDKASYKEHEATIIVFTFIASLGMLFVFAYGYIFGADILAFAKGEWSAQSQQSFFDTPTKGDFRASFFYLLYASYYLLGFMQVWMAIILGILGLFAYRKGSNIGLVLIALTPLVFNYIGQVSGATIVLVPDFSKEKIFFNERYALTWYPIVLATASVFTALLAKELKAKRLAIFFALLFLLLNVNFLYTEGFTKQLPIIRQGMSGYHANLETEAGQWLKANYDFGFVLTTRAFNNMVLVSSNLPLSRYVQESNNPYYQTVINNPHLFARYVIMFSDEEGNPLVTAYSKNQDQVYGRLHENESFHSLYDKVFDNKGIAIYKIREQIIQGIIDENNLTLTLPSVSRAASKKDEMYNFMQSVKALEKSESAWPIASR